MRSKGGNIMIHMHNKEFFTLDFPLHVFEERQMAYAPHSHEFFELVYLIDGQGTHQFGATLRTIQPGDVYLIRPDEVHAYYPAAGTTLRLVNVLFLTSLLDDTPLGRQRTKGHAALPYVELLFQPQLPLTHDLNIQGMLAYQTEQLLHTMQTEALARAPGYEAVLKNLFCTLLIWLGRAYSRQSESTAAPAVDFGRGQMIVATARSYIEAHCAETITLDDVAAVAAVSPSHLAHVFKAQTKRSVIGYLHEYRVRRICDELIQTDLPVQKIATRMGFNDVSFFYRVFQRLVGCSPTMYRRQTRASTLDTVV